MHAALTLWRKHMRKFLRSRMELVAALLFPLLLMGMFGVAMRRFLSPMLGGDDYLAYILPGILALTALTASVLGGATLLNERMKGVLREYLAAPIPRSSILLATLASALTKAMFQTAIILLIALALGVRPVWSLSGLLTAVLAFLGYTTAFVGLATAAAAASSSVESYHSLIMLFNVPLLFTANAFYPLASMPGWLMALAMINPTTYLMDAMREGLFGQPGFPGAAGDLLLLWAFAIVSVALAVRSFRRVAV